MNRSRILHLFAPALFLPTLLVGQAYEDPARFEDQIAAFEAQDARIPPPENAVLCIGSSSMRGWHDTIDEDLAPLTLIKRGFGGSTMNDLFHFTERIVIPYQPRAILVYEGDNDVAQGVSPQGIANAFLAFRQAVRSELPRTRIYVLSVKPSPARWDMWPQIQQANTLLREICDQDGLLTFVDISAGMLKANGEPRPEIFQEDDLHMNALGYESWAKQVSSILVPAEIAYEQP